MFGISGFELLIIAVFVLIIFGPDKLPELARMMGRAMRTFKAAQEDMERVLKAEMYSPEVTARVAAAQEQAEEAPVVPAAAAEDRAASIWASSDEDEEEEDEE